MEFESKSLRVEKVVAANSEGVINVRALKPGRYEFYDDFNDKARGALTRAIGRRHPCWPHSSSCFARCSKPD